MLIRLTRFRLQRPADDGADLGGAPTPAAEQPSAVVEAPAADASQSQQAPGSMLEAIERHFNRDEQGRFAPKPEGEQAPAAAAQTDAAAQAAAKAQQPAQAKDAAKPAAPADEQMPEGLGQKAQERFRALSAQVREGQQQIEQLSQQVEYVRDTFQTNGISREQFEQAAGFLGAINRGDLQTAERVLLGQLQQLSLLTGKTYGPAVDALAEFPDLRRRVDALELSEADALRIARFEQQEAARQRQAAEQQQAQQVEMTQRQAVQKATAAVDQWWQQTAATDIDAPAIEAQLLPHVQTLLRGLPPDQWVPVLQAQYQMLKGAVGAVRKTATAEPAAPSPLRPTGSGAAVQQRPTSLYDAMWSRA